MRLENNSITASGASTVSLNATNAMGSGSLTASGNTIVNLNFANASLAGGVTISGNSTLNINALSGLGTGPVTINGGTINNNVATVFPSLVNLGGSFSFGGTNTLNLNTVQLTGNVTATALNGTASLTLINLIPNGNSFVLSGAYAGNFVIAQPGLHFRDLGITAPGTLTWSSTAPTLTGTLFASGGAVNQPNSQTNPFTVSGGTVTINPNDTLNAAGLVIANTAFAGGNNSGEVNVGTGANLIINSANNVLIGFYNAANTTPIGAILNAAGNSAVSITTTGGASILIGGNTTANSAQRQNVIVTLGAGSNLLSTTGTVWVDQGGAGGQDGNTGAQGTGQADALGQSTLNFGSGKNTVVAATFNIAGEKGPGARFLASNVANAANFNLPTQESPLLGLRES